MSYASIAKKYGVSVQAVKKRALKEGWQNLRQRTIQKVDQKLPELISESIAQVQARHAEHARLLQNKGLEALQNGKKPRNSREAIYYLV